MNALREVYEEVKRTPYPLLADNLEDFELYEEGLMRLSSKVLAGKSISFATFPALTTSERQYRLNIAQKQERNTEEEYFLNYCRLLHRLASAIKESAS